MIGLDISDRSVKVVQLSNDKSRHFIMRGWYEVAEGLIVQGKVQNKEKAVDMLKGVLDHDRMPGGDNLVVSIPEAQSFLRVVELPRMSEGEISEAVKWEVAQHMPFGLENMYMDWQWISKSNSSSSDRISVLVGASQKEVVDALWGVLASLGRTVVALELEAQAVVRSLITEELKRKKGLLIVDIGSSVTNVIVHDEGSIRYTTTLNKGAEMLLGQLGSRERAEISGPPEEEHKYDRDVVEQRLMPIMDELAVEVMGIEEYYMAQNKAEKAKEILLTGGGANYPGLDRAFSKVFQGAYVQRGNPWVNVLTAETGATLPVRIEESVHYATATGLALRDPGVWAHILPRKKWRMSWKGQDSKSASAGITMAPDKAGKSVK